MPKTNFTPIEVDTRTGMWAVYDLKGNKQFVYPVDAREQVESGCATLYDPVNKKLNTPKKEEEAPVQKIKRLKKIEPKEEAND